MALVYKYDINDVELMETHSSNNRKILEYLTEFKEANNLTSQDFIVGGSCAGSYLDCMTLKCVRDIDIIPIDADKELVKTSKIDIIQYPYYTTGFEERAIYKDGFYFCSFEDLLIQEATASIVRRKIKHIDYTGNLIRFHNISPEELCSKVRDALPLMDRILDTHKEIAIKNLPIIRFRYGGAKCLE